MDILEIEANAVIYIHTDIHTYIHTHTYIFTSKNLK